MVRKAEFDFTGDKKIKAVFKINPVSSSYKDLTDKPSINDVELIGNKTTEDLHIDVDIDERVEAHNQSEEAHSFIQNKISEEEQARITADEDLQRQIDEKGGDITQERAERIAADEQLQENINTEEQERIQADTNLQNQIDTKQPLLTSDNAGEGISITGSGINVKINNTRNSAEWGNITGNIEDQEDLQEALNDKWQAGDGVSSLVTKGNKDNGGQALGDYSVAEGFGSDAKGNYSHVEGQLTTANGDCAHAEGQGTTARGNCAHAEGIDTIAQNQSEHAEGQYNKSHIASNTFGNAGNTIHSVGIGTGAGSLEEQDRRNAIEIMQNGDAYLYGVGDYDGQNYDTAKTLQEAINEGGKGTAYASLRKVKPYLYQATYTNVDYAFANEYFKTKKPQIDPGACSTVRKGNLFSRNFDWSYNQTVSFVVNTPAIGNKYASVSVSTNVPLLDEPYMASGEYNDESFKLVPFFALDGVNECGLTVSSMVVPTQKGITTGTTPTVEKRDEICSLMLNRYILDNFAAAQEACEYIQQYVSVYAIKSLLQMGYDLHLLISDKTSTYALEFINNAVVYMDVTDKPYMTNFFLHGVTFLEDGKVYTPATVSQGLLPSSLGLTSESSGLERYNKIIENYENLNSVAAMQQFMCGSYDVPTLRYTQSYRAQTNPQWNTEFVGSWDFDFEGQHYTVNLTVDSPESDFTVVKNYVRTFYERGERDGKTWQTEHSSVYDIENKKLYIQVQEDGEELEFGLEYYTRREVDEKFQPLLTAENAGEGISITGSGKNMVISNTSVSAEWGNITGNIEDQTDLQQALDSKENTIFDLETIRSNASNGQSAYTTISGYGNIVTHNTNEFATASQGAKADSALQPNDNISELINDVGYITGISSSDVVNALGYTPVDNTITINNKQLNQNINLTYEDVEALPDITFIPSVINNVTSTDTSNALSANMGKELSDRLQNVESRGRFLSTWDCTTGLAQTTPTTDPYTYEKGDYFIVGKVAVEGGVNYRPSGSQYSESTPSTEIETIEVKVNDTYIYDSQAWIHQSTADRTVTFSSIAGQPTDNANLASALNDKYDASNPAGYISGITSSDVTTALGYTPYNATNPNNYISRTGISATTPINYNSTTGVISVASGYQITTTAQVSQIGTNTNDISTINNTLSTYGNIVTHDADEFLVSTTKYGSDLSYTNSQLQLKDQDGNLLGNPVTISSGASSFSELSGSPYDNTNLASALNNKQNTLTSDNAGDNITIVVGGSHNLPEEYQEVEYIESTGEQRIDTGVNGSCRIKTKAKYTSLTTSSAVLFSLTDQSAGGTWFGGTANGKWGCGTTYAQETTIPVTTKAELDITFGDTGVTAIVNNETASRGTSSTLATLSIFSATSGQFWSEVQLEIVEVYQDNSLVQHLIPAKRISDNEIGMYDLVTSTFFTNAGTGSFVAGEDVNPITKINALSGLTASITELNYTDGVTSNIQTQLNDKQATISDLSTIRSGAALGATALQSVPSEYVTETELQAYHDNTKQDELVSGTNIKTINNTSILGSGNIDIQGVSSFAELQGSPYDNTNLSNALNDKQDTLTEGTGINITDNVISNTRFHRGSTEPTNPETFIWIEYGLTPEQIQALLEMTVSIDNNGELIMTYDDDILDFTFEIIGKNLVVNNNIEDLTFSIVNNNLEATYI